MINGHSIPLLESEKGTWTTPSYQDAKIQQHPMPKCQDIDQKRTREEDLEQEIINEENNLGMQAVLSHQNIYGQQYPTLGRGVIIKKEAGENILELTHRNAIFVTQYYNRKINEYIRHNPTMVHNSTNFMEELRTLINGMRKCLMQAQGTSHQPIREDFVEKREMRKKLQDLKGNIGATEETITRIFNTHQNQT